jgi:hypothetical protein
MRPDSGNEAHWSHQSRLPRGSGGMPGKRLGYPRSPSMGQPGNVSSLRFSGCAWIRHSDALDRTSSAAVVTVSLRSRNQAVRGKQQAVKKPFVAGAFRCSRGERKATMETGSLIGRLQGQRPAGETDCPAMFLPDCTMPRKHLPNAHVTSGKTAQCWLGM